MRIRQLGILFFFAGAFTMFVMSLHYFQNYMTGVLKGKSVSNELWYHVALRIHIVLGMAAMFTGPLQFVSQLRKKFPIWHRRLGYLYVLSIFVSSIAGFVVAQFAMGGLMSALGFSILAIFWFSTTLLAIRYAIKKDIVRHQKWMIRSFALTFSSIPQRLMLLLAITPYVDFIDVYRLSAWISWILNLLIAQYIIAHLKRPNPKEKIFELSAEGDNK